MKKITLILLFISINSFSQCWQQLSAGNEYTVAIAQNGSLWAWGRNDSGQLGDGTFIDRWEAPTQISTQTTWAQVATGKQHTVAIKSDGTLWVWGSNAYGQLGTGNTTISNIPIQIGTATNWAQITASLRHSFAIKTDGTLWAWGVNDSGQLGDGTINNRNSPVQIGSNSNWTKIKTGANFPLGLNTDGVLFSWGSDNGGQLGNGGEVWNPSHNLIPLAIPGFHNYSDIACGVTSGYAIKTDGTLWSWGSNSFGNLGHGNFNTFYTSPLRIGSETNWTKISGGITHLLALKNNNSLWACGRNHRGQLGNNAIVTSTVLIPINSGISYITIYTGNSSGDDGLSGVSFAVKSDGNLQSWGDNNRGQLATGARFNNYLTPQNVACPTAFTLGISNNSKTEMSIYPNPTSNILSVDIENTSNFEIAIYDLIGKKVGSYKNQKQLDITGLNKGVYIIKVTNNDNAQIIAHKIIKQ